MLSNEEMTTEVKRQRRIIGPLLNEAMKGLMKKIDTPTAATSVAIFHELLVCAAQVSARCRLPDMDDEQFIRASNDIASAMCSAGYAATDLVRKNILERS